MTVSDIAQYAGINRATFYRHYQDKFDLLNEYAQTVYELLDAPPEPKSRKLKESDATQLMRRLVTIFEHIRANAKFYRIMLGKNGDPQFSDNFRQYIEKRIRRSLPAGLQSDNRSVDLYVSYSSGASLGAVLWWLEHEMPYSSEEMANIILKLEQGNLKAIPRVD